MFFRCFVSESRVPAPQFRGGEGSAVLLQLPLGGDALGASAGRRLPTESDRGTQTGVLDSRSVAEHLSSVLCLFPSGWL